jgi:D-arginine dehydrogenase
MNRADIVVVGAGIAGASLAAELAPFAHVVVIEAEEMPGYHATGRSAAYWSETYGGPYVQPLTTASRQALDPYLQPMGSLHIGRARDCEALEKFVGDFEGTDVTLQRVDPATIVPGLRTDWVLGVLEPSCAYIDVARLHADCLARMRKGGVELKTNAQLESATRASGRWSITTAQGSLSADILIDAAGAWADPVAERAGVAPLGIRAFRRTMVQLRTDPRAPSILPHVSAIDGSFYFKPEAQGKLWLSPHDEIPTDACDAAPEEIDVATAIDRFEHAVDWRVEAVERKWAGLRSFAPDRLPVYGFDDVPGFFWCAGQGGFGIQTAPAAAKLAAALVLGQRPDPMVAHIDPTLYTPTRFGI